MVIDPSLSLVPRRAELPRVDRVLNSHCHEDHIAGNHLFPDVPWHLHEADVPGIASLDGMMAIYGFDGRGRATPSPRSSSSSSTSRRAPTRARSPTATCSTSAACACASIHAPGHTRGHCCFHVEPDDVLYLGDIDLSSFGPYYGDAWSSLEDFERTLGDGARHRGALVRHVPPHRRARRARGVPRAPRSLRRRDRAIASARLLEFLAEPHTLDEIAAHRFVYRPQRPRAVRRARRAPQHGPARRAARARREGDRGGGGAIRADGW